MRLLFVNSVERLLGGAERLTLTLARGLIARGHDVTVVGRGESRLGGAARAAGVPVTEIPMRGDFEPGAVRALAELIRDRRADAVFSTTPRAMMLGGHAAVFCGLRGVVARMLAGWTPGEAAGEPAHRRWVKGCVYRALVRRAVTNSAAGRDEAVARGWLPRNRIEVITNGVDLSRFPKGAAAEAPSASPRRAPRGPAGAALRRELGLPGEATVILSLSRVARHKGQLTELRAAREIIARHEGVHFLFVGGARDEAADYLGRVEAERGLAADPSRIRFLGERDDAPALLDASDLLIRITTAEGLPNAVLEAMAASRPVVASRVCGTPEAVVEGRTGLLVEPERPDEVVSALERLLARPEERIAMGIAGRARAEAVFPLERTIEAYERLFEGESG